MNMIEKIARAIWDTLEDEFTFDDAKSANDGKGDSAYHFAIMQAKAALSALKDPTSEMQNAGYDAMMQDHCTYRKNVHYNDIYDAMIEAAEQGE